MITIELDAFEAFIEAVNEGGDGRELVANAAGRILRHLYEAGWRLTRVPVPVIEATPAALPSHAWPPAGISGQFWSRIAINGDLQLIDGPDGLREAKRSAAPIYKAPTYEIAEGYARNPGRCMDETFRYDGEEFDYLTEVPF